MEIKVPLFNLQKENHKIWEEIKDPLATLFKESKFILGEEVKKFEEEFAAYCGTKYAVAVNSGTSALLLSLLASGVRKGEEVITVPFTFIATVEAIIFAGARPVFVDIHPQTLTLDVEKLEKAITSKTRAIIPVHLFGEVCHMEPLMEIARRYNLLVIEDACQAHGAEYLPWNKKAGSMGECGCFSFYPTKNLGGWGEGGMVVTDNPELARRIKMLRDHGSVRKYLHQMVGLNCRMESFQGLILRHKLKSLEERNSKRRELAFLYHNLLKDLKEIVIPRSPPYSKGVFHLYVIRTSQREELKRYLERQGIQTGIYYPLPLHLQESLKFLKYRKGDFPVSEKLSQEVLALPLYPELDKETVIWITTQIRKFFKSPT